MSFEKTLAYLTDLGIGDRVMHMAHSSATVEEAAVAVGCEGKQIAKTMSFLLQNEQPILVVTAGDTKIDNKKFKAHFAYKPKMIAFADVEKYVGHAPGGVCPFNLPSNVKVYLDISLQRFDIVYPAAGDDHSAVRLTPAELEKYSGSLEWVDVCKIPE